MFKKTVKLLMVTALTVSMTSPAVVCASDYDAAEVVYATKEDFGDIHSTDNEDALEVYADNGYAATVTTGNVESDKGTGVEVWAKDASEVKVTVNGDVTAHKIGVDAQTEGDGSTVNVKVTGDVSADSESDEAVYAQSYGGDVTVSVEGDVQGGDCGIVANSWIINYPNASTGATNVFVGGDVSGSVCGISASSYVANGSDGNIVAENNIVVVGTVYGGEVGVDSDAFPGGNNIITVWKIETDKGGVIAGTYDFGEDKYEENEEVEKNIRYIIKVDQPIGATLRATDSNGKALATVDAANGKSYEYALQGDKVLLKIDVNDGYNLDAVYGDDGKQYVLGKDASGNYYIMVPAGGGVKFSAVLSQKGNDKGDDDDDKKEETPVVVNIAQNAPVFTNTATVAAAVTEAAVTSITETPAGGTANIALSSSTVDASVVRMIIARRDINVSLACFVNGQLCNIMIPAGADLSDILNPDGTIDIEKLAKKFGKTEVK